jgi:hypothetical protein
MLNHDIITATCLCGLVFVLSEIMILASHTHTQAPHTAAADHLRPWIFRFQCSDMLKCMSNPDIITATCLCGLVFVLSEIMIFASHTHTQAPHTAAADHPKLLFFCFWCSEMLKCMLNHDIITATCEIMILASHTHTQAPHTAAADHLKLFFSVLSVQVCLNAC